MLDSCINGAFCNNSVSLSDQSRLSCYPLLCLAVFSSPGVHSGHRNIPTLNPNILGSFWYTVKWTSLSSHCNGIISTWPTKETQIFLAAILSLVSLPLSINLLLVGVNEWEAGTWSASLFPIFLTSNVIKIHELQSWPYDDYCHIHLQTPDTLQPHPGIFSTGWSWNL